MISVCLATYNGEKYIEKMLQSILCQLNEDDEIIIVDDCSKDNTMEFLNMIDDKRIEVLQNQSNIGVNKTFERAIKHARGELIFLADQDDIWKSNKISMICELFNDDSNVDLVHHDAYVIDEYGNSICESFYKWRGNVGTGCIKNFIRDTHLGCCMAFRKRIVKDILPITSIPYHDRWIGIVSSMLGYQEKYIEDKLIFYVRHEGNTTNPYLHRRKVKKIIVDRIKLLIDILKRFIKVKCYT